MKLSDDHVALTQTAERGGYSTTLGMTGLLNLYTAWAITAAGTLALLIDARSRQTRISAALPCITDVIM